MDLTTFFKKFDQFADAPDAVPKLRELVLELAASGRLVPEALERPVEQDTRLMGSLVELVMGQAPAGSECNTEGRGTVFVKVGEFGPLYPREEVWTTDPLKFAKKGDVLVCVVGATVGKLNLAIDCAIGRSVAAIRPSPALDTKFLYYSLIPYTLHLRRNSRGSAQGVIGKAELNAVSLWVPRREVQKRIVAKVDELMALCDRLEAQQQERETRHATLARASLARFAAAPTSANLNLLFHSSFSIPPSDLRKSILTLAVQGKLVPQDPNDEPAEELLARLAREITPEQRRSQAAPLPPLPAESLQYEVPDSWTWARFRDVAIIASNLVKPDEFLEFTHLAPDNIEKGNGVLLPCRTVREDKVISSNHRFYPGQIVYSKIRPNLAKVVVVDFEGLCSADMYPIDALIDPFYLQLYMLSESFLMQSVKADTRVAMPKINQTELNAIAVPIPPLAEQRRIVAKVEQLMTWVDALEQQLAASRATAESLLTALVAELTRPPTRATEPAPLLAAEDPARYRP